MVAVPDFDQITDEVATLLIARFTNVDPAYVRSVTAEEVRRLSGSPVTNYIGVLAGRAAKQRLLDAMSERAVA